MMNVLLGLSKNSKFMSLENNIKSINEAVTFSYCFDVFEGVILVDKNDFDLAILTIEKDFDGIDLGNRIHLVSPKTKIMYVSDSEKHCLKAFKTRAVSYLINPTVKDLKEELEDLKLFKSTTKATAITFGNFDLYANGVPVKFSKSKSKELLAFLIYKRGTSASSSELIVNLWEDKDVDRTTRSMLHNYLGDIRKTLDSYGISDIFSYERNNYRIIKENISCDYFKMLDGDKNAINSYLGEFMSGYEWALYVEPELNNIKYKQMKK